MVNEIQQDITIPPAPPTGLYDADFQNKVNSLLAWFNTHAVEETTFIEKLNAFVLELNGVLPSVNAAASMADLTQYRGEWGAQGTPTTINTGESVSIGNTFYVSKIDGNTDSPPSVNWVEQGEQYIKKNGGAIVGDLDVQGNLTKSGHIVADIMTYMNTLLSVSTTSTSFDPNAVENGNPDHINIVSNHANTPDSTYYWHINTQFYSSTDNCRQIAAQYNNGADMYVRSRYNKFWTNWKKVAYTSSNTGWFNVSKINGWTGNLYYKKFNDGTVVVTGAPYNSSGSSGWGSRQICTLPAGYRPSTTMYAAAASNRHNAGGVPRAMVYADGRIFCETIGAYYMYMTFIYKAEN